MTTTAPVRAPWWHMAGDPPCPACALCNHGVDVGDVRHCTRYEVVGNHPKPVHLVRGPHGPCGPDAEFLDFPGLAA